MIFNPNVIAISRGDLATENITVVTICSGVENIHLISAYFKFRQPIRNHCQDLSDILDKLDGKIIIAADVNAHATLWYNTRTTRKGNQVLDLIHQHDLQCHNKLSQISTFNGPTGSTNIDVTLTNQTAAHIIGRWAVEDGITTSLHNAISFSLLLTLPIYQKRPPRYATDKADLEKYRATLIGLVSNNHPQSGDIEHQAEWITDCICRAADAAIPRRKNHHSPKPPWRNKELQLKRNELKKSI